MWFRDHTHNNSGIVGIIDRQGIHHSVDATQFCIDPDTKILYHMRKQQRRYSLEHDISPVLGVSSATFFGLEALRGDAHLKNSRIEQT